jgi:hypothetical protein
MFCITRSRRSRAAVLGGVEFLRAGGPSDGRGRVAATARVTGLAGIGVVAELLAEIDPRGRLHSVGAVPEIDRVQVFGEDLLLRPLVREVEGHRGLADLFEDRPVVLLGQCVLDELLGDRRGTLDRVAGRIVDQGADRALEIDAGVGPERLVLGGDDGAAHVPADVGVGVDDLVVGRRELSDQPALVVVEVGVAFRAVLALVLQLGQIGGDRHDHPEHERHGRQRAEPDQDRQEAQLPDPGARAALAVATPAATAPSRGRERDRLRGRAVRRGDVVVAHAIVVKCVRQGP